MPKESIIQRMLCSHADIRFSDVRNGVLGDVEWNRLTRSAGDLSSASIFFYDVPVCTVLDVKGRARRVAIDKSVDMIIIDYLQLMKGVGQQESRQQEISAISRGLKQVARELNVPVIALSQLSRGG